jgi:small subunit ribosomal protein S8
MMTDPIADMLTRIRNASAVHRTDVVVPFSTLKLEIAKVLQLEGYIEEVVVDEAKSPFKQLKLTLKYDSISKEPAIRHISRISTPGRRVYVKRDEVPQVLNGYGIAILSTSRGVLSCQQARRSRVGGELICELW